MQSYSEKPQKSIISLRGVCKSFDLGRVNTLKKYVSRYGRGDYFIINAIKDLSLDIRKGEVVGIFGPNGSGKSTLLKIISGIIHPDNGTIKINGKVAPILEFGSGLHHELSGLDNIYLYSSILGIPRQRVSKYIVDIINFSDLKKFINLPLKKYSSGMRSRLAFSIAIFSDADILVFDEVFAVGDMSFRDKGLRFLNELKGKKTIILTSHDWGLMSQICDRFLLIDEGRLVNEQNEAVISFIKEMPLGERFLVKAESNSMYPAIQMGNFITIEKVKFSIIKPNDIVAFYRENIPQIIVHRIVDIKDGLHERTLLTKGDNSFAVDSQEVDTSHFLGKVIQ